LAIAEGWKIRHIVIATPPGGPKDRTEAQALEVAKKVATDLHLALAEVKASDSDLAAQAKSIRFANLARQYSEDGSAESGGDLGWVTKGQLDSDFEVAALALKTGTPSGIVKTKYGYHIIYIEGHRPAGTMSLEDARPRIREALLSEHGAEIIEAVNKLTNELRNSSRISVYPENVR
jgi:parvulin-like peptidyl-prolyl isomerase